MKFRRIASLFILQAILSGASASGTPVRVAIVSNLNEPGVQDGLALAETALADVNDLHRIERQQISAVMKEHHLTLGGVADPAMAVKVGKLVTADLFAVVSGNPAAKQREVLSIVIFDARTGVRFVDRAAAAEPAKMSAALTEAVKAAVAKYRAGNKALKTISIVRCRNVDLGPGRDDFCAGIGQLLQRNLTASPQVAVLERSYLEHVNRERVISQDAPISALLASMLCIGLEFSHGRKETIEVVASIDERKGTKRKVSVSVSAREVGRLSDLLLAAVSKELDAKHPVAAFDRAAEAKGLMAEAIFLCDLKRFDESFALGEASLALAPDEPTLWPQMCWILTKRARPQGWILDEIRDSSPQKFEMTAVWVSKAVDLFARARRYESAHSRIMFTDNSAKHDMADWDFNIGGLLLSLNEYANGQTETAKNALDAATHRYLSIFDGVPERLLPKLGTPLFEAAMWRGHVEGHEALPSGSQEWANRICQTQRLLLDRLNQTGAVTLPPQRLTWDVKYVSTYVHLLDLEMPREFWRPSDRTIPPGFRHTPAALYDSMVQHRLPAVQILGRGGQLLVDMAKGPISDSEVERRLQEIVDFAEKKIEDPGTERVGVERAACYEAIVCVGEAVALRQPSIQAWRDKSLAFMLSRNEVVLSVVASVAYRQLVRWSVDWQQAVVYRAHSLEPKESREQVAAKLLPLAKLIAAKKTRILDGNQRAIEAVLNFLTEHKSDDGIVKRPPLWTRARKLIEVDDRRYHNSYLDYWGQKHGLAYLSKPVLQGGDAYVVGLFVERSRPLLKLLHIGLADGKVTRISGINGKSVPEGEPAAFSIPAQRHHDPLGQPYICDGHVYCPSAYYGAIFVFPLDGSEPYAMTPKTSPGMATGEIDEIAILDDGVFALSSGLPNSYVLWYDRKEKRWETIASGNRAEKKTLLDYGERYVNTMLADPPRHRVLFCVRRAVLDCLHSGLYEFDAQSRRINKLFAFRAENCVWMQAMGQEKVWISFGFDRRSRDAFEYDYVANRWRSTISNRPGFNFKIDAKPVDTKGHRPLDVHWDIVTPPGLRTDRPQYAGKHYVNPPFAMIDGWLWCFNPLCRISPDGKRTEEFPELEKEAIPSSLACNIHEWTDYDSYPGLPNSLIWLPDKRWLIYGCRFSLWVLELPPAEKARSSP